jgi:hypothetical protein
MLMDVKKTLRAALAALKAERDRIEYRIGALEGILNPNGLLRGSGRRQKKGMSPEGRKALSRRMKAYWAKWRKAKARQYRARH